MSARSKEPPAPEPAAPTTLAGAPVEPAEPVVEPPPPPSPDDGAAEPMPPPLWKTAADQVLHLPPGVVDRFPSKWWRRRPWRWSSQGWPRGPQGDQGDQRYRC